MSDENFSVIGQLAGYPITDVRVGAKLHFQRRYGLYFSILALDGQIHIWFNFERPPARTRVTR